MPDATSTAQAGPDAALHAACAALAQADVAYAAAVDPASPDAFRRLGDLLNARAAATISVAEVAAVTDAGRRAKAHALLNAIDRLDPLPEFELARSLAYDVVGGRP